MPWRRAWLLAFPMSLVVLGALYHDIQRSHITTSDPDIVYVYEALLYNAGLPQNNFDHPGYIYFLLLGWWFRLLRTLQLVPIADYSVLIAAPAATIDAAYAKLIIAGRWLSVLMTTSFVAALFIAVWRLTYSSIAATAAALAFALSTGIAVQANLLRNELPSAFFTFLAFMALVEAARARSARSDCWLAAAGLCAVLALTAKIQAVFVLLGLPALLIAFIDWKPATSPAMGDDGLPARAWLLVPLSLALAAPAAMMVVQTIRFNGGSGAYQALIAAYIIGMMTLYALHERLSLVRFITGAMALVVGIALGILSLLVRHNVAATQAISMLVEHMTVFSSLASDSSTALPGSDLPRHVLGGAVMAAQSRLSLSYDPMQAHRILELILLAGALIAARAKLWRLAIQAVLILGLVWTVETAFGLRGMRPNYRIYVDPWLTLGTGLLVASALPRLARARSWQKAAAVVATVVVALAFVRQAADANVVDRQSVENACLQMSNAREPLAQHFSQYCTGRPAR